MPVYLGQTFVNEPVPGVRQHLWIVLSDPARSERVVLANVQGYAPPVPRQE